jgi:type IV secretory pathway VirB2 component (pilin)
MEFKKLQMVTVLVVLLCLAAAFGSASWRTFLVHP